MEYKLLLHSSFVLIGMLVSLGCQKPSEPDFNNPYDEQSDTFIETPGLNTMEVTNVEVPTAVSGGQFTNDYGYEVTSKGVCWGTQENPTRNDQSTEESSGREDFTSNLDGLEYNRTYYVRANTQNQADVIYGGQQQFTTEEAIYELTINIMGEGIIEETVIEEPSKTEYTAGTVVESKAISTDNWRFDHWETDLTGDNNPEQIINTPKEIDAIFQELIEWSFLTGSSVASSPAIGLDGTIYIGSWDNNLYAITPEGSLDWGFQTDDAVVSSPAITTDGTNYVGSYDDFLYALTPGGSLKWKYHTASGIGNSPAIASDGTIYVGSSDNNLDAINSNGSLKWSFQTNDIIISSPALAADGSIFINPAISPDGTIFLGSDDHSVYAISGKSFRPASSSWPMFGQT